MRRLVAVCVAALAFTAATARAAIPSPPVYVVNESTTLTDAQIGNAIPAFQQALDTAFAPFYGPDPTIIQIPAGGTAPFDAWTVTIQDVVADCFCYGYHDVAAGVPYARVETDGKWTVTFTHELFEMLADPYINRVAGPAFKGGMPTRLYTYEVCDPVEADRYGFILPGGDGAPILISDFVTDRWFSGQGGGLLDYMGHVHHAGRVLSGGYIWVWEGGAWREITG